MFKTVLVANRGEIACRAIRTLKRLGIISVAVHSDIDKNEKHVREADVAINIGGKKANESYLVIDKIIRAAIESRAQAIWPGYGFLSESLPFASACIKAGIIFIGPTEQQIKEFGLKHRARELAIDANIPILAGSGLLTSIKDAISAANRIGYPVILKSTAGGGGIGLKICGNPIALNDAWESVRRLSQQFFNDEGVFLERYIERARHIEVQIFGDGKGTVIALGERDCSLQRRNQKVVEETPAPNLPLSTRSALLASAVNLGKLVNYRSVGTVEYIYNVAEDKFFFLEVNTRLQVEHSITECVTGLDLIECMLQVASGEKPNWNRMLKEPTGTSIEVRIYAEDPLKNFQPSPGILSEVYFPNNIRVDSGIDSGSEVSIFYDPMLAKVIVHAENRNVALEKMLDALNKTRLHGISTNLDYLRQIVATKAFRDGITWTKMLDNFIPYSPIIEVVQPGTWSSIQDYPGRIGYWNVGIPPSGPMDDYAFRLSNRIVGNAVDAAALEFTFDGPILYFHSDTLIALTGAYCPTTLDGIKVTYWKPIKIQAGQKLVIGRARYGCRTFLAVRNGFDAPTYLGSRSTFALGKFGGQSGRILRQGDMLNISQPKLAACTTSNPVSEPLNMLEKNQPKYSNNWHIGVLYGPHGAPDYFTQESIEEFFNATWKVHYNSNRLGIRLVGPKPIWARVDGGEAGLHPSNIHDCAYAIGSINFTGDFPVILTCDGPSLGGFVCPVTIAKAELWKVGQLKPGDHIHFYPITFEEANVLEKSQQRSINQLSALSYPKFFLSSRIKKLRNLVTILAEIKGSSTTPSAIYRQAGDKCILLEYGENILDLGLRLRVHLLMQELSQLNEIGVEELSPGVRSLQIRYNSQILSQKKLINLLLHLEKNLGKINNIQIPSRILHLPMTFQDTATLEAVERYIETVRINAPWLPNNVNFIQRINGLTSNEELKTIIFNANYLILGLGDVYLGAPCAVAVDPRHRLLSSKYNPARTFTAEGTVGIGGMYMCIYGIDSPGGYQLVGRTLPIWNKFIKNKQCFLNTPWLLRYFDQIKFYEVSQQKLEQLREDFHEGRLNIYIEKTVFNFEQYTALLSNNAKSIDDFRRRQSNAFSHEVALWTEKGEEYESTRILPSADTSLFEEENTLSVIANLHGNIWKVLVNLGDYVEIGQPVIIIEAMKMELIIDAPKSGYIKRINCQPGHTVSPGDKLLWIE